MPPATRTASLFGLFSRAEKDSGRRPGGAGNEQRHPKGVALGVRAAVRTDGSHFVTSTLLALMCFLPSFSVTTPVTVAAFMLSGLQEWYFSVLPSSSM